MNRWTVLINYGEYACGLFETEEEAKKEIVRLMRSDEPIYKNAPDDDVLKCDSEKYYDTLLIINAD